LDRRLEMLGSENFLAVTKTHVRLFHFTWFVPVCYNFGEKNTYDKNIKHDCFKRVTVTISGSSNNRNDEFSILMSKFFEVWLFFPCLFSWKQCCGRIQ